MAAFPRVLERIGDLNQDQILKFLRGAQAFKAAALDKTQPLTSNATVATFFRENSTRTKLSFQMAALNLGMRHIHLEAQTSSLQKGEDLEQTFLTLAHLGVDLCVYRTPLSGELEKFKNPSSSLSLSIINGGDGTHEHPTQALLDLFTMREHGLGPEGKTVSIIGDCRHSRVCHSLMALLPMFGAKILLCGPNHFLPHETPPETAIQKTTSLEEAVTTSEIVYLLRVQKERHTGDSPMEMENYPHQYGLTWDKLQKWGTTPPIFHAGPANIGMELDQKLIDSPLYFGHSQVRHATYMRMSIIDGLVGQQLKLKEKNKIDGDLS